MDGPERLPDIVLTRKFLFQSDQRSFMNFRLKNPYVTSVARSTVGGRPLVDERPTGPRDGPTREPRTRRGSFRALLVLPEPREEWHRDLFQHS
jgi:hypothetical protein